MKKLIIPVLGCLLSAGGFAQQLSIENPVIREKDSLVTVSFNAHLQTIESNERILLTPVLYHGGDMLMLQPMVVSGRKKSLSDRRKGFMPGKRMSKEGGTLFYTATVPSAQWMDSLSLRVLRETENCCRIKQLPELAVATGVEVRFRMQPVYPQNTFPIPPTALQQFDQQALFLSPIAEYETAVKNFDALREKGALLVYFKQGAAAVDLSYKGNISSLDQVKKVLALIEADPTATLEKIVLAGAASPEGSAASNLILARKRADALKTYLDKDFSQYPDLFEVVNLGEDWTTLRRLVDEDIAMPGREKALSIMDRYSVNGGREVELMKLNAGRPYRYMMEHFFPQLRNAGYIQIYYESKPDTTLLELNRAILLINDRHYAEALSVLRPLRQDGRTENLTGVCLMMMQQYPEAERHLDRAIEAGDADAPRNREQLLKAKAMKDSMRTAPITKN